MEDKIELSDEGLRQLAAALLEAITSGNSMDNVIMLANFNSNLLAGLILGSTNGREQAEGALDAFTSDVRRLMSKYLDPNQQL